MDNSKFLVQVSIRASARYYFAGVRPYILENIPTKDGVNLSSALNTPLILLTHEVARAYLGQISPEKGGGVIEVPTHVIAEWGIVLYCVSKGLWFEGSPTRGKNRYTLQFPSLEGNLRPVFMLMRHRSYQVYFCEKSV